MRLIDADAVIKAVDRHTKDESEIVLDNDISCILEEVPTAYDVEMVVEQLEEMNGCNLVLDDGSIIYSNDVIPRKEAIEIVKGGGRE